MSLLLTLSTPHILLPCFHHWLQQADASGANNYSTRSCTACGNMTLKEYLKLSQDQ